MPIHNWFQFFKTGELKYFSKTGEKTHKETYYKIMDSFRLEIGFSTKYDNEIKMKKYLLKLQIEYLTKQDLTILDEIEQLEIQFQKTESNISIDDALPFVFERIGYFDKTKMSTYDYYKLLK